VPELLGKGTVVLNMTTLADIMLGTVDKWNHAAIVALNPDLAAFLPNKPITVVTPTDPDTVLLFTRALSAVSSEFATAVCSPPHATPRTHARSHPSPQTR
jgi:ABC-type phosphate transport system substrate-binding protein